MTRAKSRVQTVEVYNSTDGPIPYDAEGHVVPARESVEVPVADLEGDPLADHIAAGRFVTPSDTETDDGDVVEVSADPQE